MALVKLTARTSAAAFAETWNKELERCLLAALRAFHPFAKKKDKKIDRSLL